MVKVAGRPHGLMTQAGREECHLICKCNSQRRKTTEGRGGTNRQGKRVQNRAVRLWGRRKEEESRAEVRRELPLESWSSD